MSQKEWKKSRAPQFRPIINHYGLKPGEMLRSLKEFNRAELEKGSEGAFDVNEAFQMTRYLADLDKINADAYTHERHDGWGRRYPGSPMIDESFALSDGEWEALVAFRDKKPFKASKQDYINIVQELFVELAKVQGCKPPAVLHTGIWKTGRDTSFYTPHAVVLTGPKSVITVLHEYTHSLGYGEVVAVRWSTNAFRLLYPKAFKKLVPHEDHPHLMVRAQEPVAEEQVAEID